MCEREAEVSYQPSRSCLIFGGFNKLEKRCDKCEKEVIKMVNNILNNLGSSRKHKV